MNKGPHGPFLIHLVSSQKLQLFSPSLSGAPQLLHHAAGNADLGE